MRSKRVLLSLILILMLVAARLIPVQAAEETDSTAEGIFTFTDSGITVDGAGSDDYEIDGTDLTIKSSGDYTLTGSCADGSVTIKRGTTDVTLTLNSLSLTSTDGACLTIGKNDRSTVIRAVYGSTLRTTDAADAVLMADSGSEVSITGDGSLRIISAGIGIDADDIVLSGEHIEIDSYADSIRASDITISGGDITLASAGAKLFDYTGTFAFRGGHVIGMCLAGHMTYPTSGIYVAFGVDDEEDDDSDSSSSHTISLTSGDNLMITDSDKYAIGGALVERDATAVILMDDELEGGVTYTLYVNSIAADSSLAHEVAATEGFPTVTTRPEARSLTYTGTSQPIAIQGVVRNGTFRYAVGTSAVAVPTSGWLSTIPLRSEPGTYYVWYRVVGDEGYSDIEPRYIGSPSIIMEGSRNIISVDESRGTATVYDDVAGTNRDIALSVVESGTVYRMYDRHRGEHFYTKDTSEMRTLVAKGWTHEQSDDFASVSASDSDAIAVYRLYNPNLGGMHFYTEDSVEAVRLRTLGWRYEGISHYVYDKTSAKGALQYRLYNPGSKSGEHNWTADETEYRRLKSLGWRDEGVCWAVITSV